MSVSITEAELCIMQLLWASEIPRSAQALLADLPSKAWKYSTLATLLGRLVEKGAISYEKRGRVFFYSPLLQESDYRQSQTQGLLKQLYQGSAKKLVAALFEEEQLSAQDIDDLKERFGR